jgi:hypothetical protein
MAFVGSLSGSVGTVAVTGSLVPGVNNTYNVGSSGSKWATVFANQLTGSLTTLADGSSYLIAGTNVTITSGASGAVTIAASSGGGTPGGADTQIQYNAGGAFAGKSTLTFASGTDTLSVTNASVTSLTASFVTSSGDYLIGGNVTVAGDVAVNGGDLTTTAATATLFNTNATTVTIAGGATSGTTVGNATGGVTLNGTATVTGDLAVNGTTSADITTTTATATLFNTTATTLNIGQAATTVSIGSTTGDTTIRNNLTVKGDLFISGSTTTIDSTVVEIQDPVIGLGFASGSVAATAGDRGFIGGITGAGNNVALIWSQNSGTFAATRTATAPGSSPVVLSTLLPMRAARLEVNGATAYITSSDAQTLELNGASGKGVKFTVGSGTEFAQFVDNGANAEFGALANKQLNLSGSQVNLNAGTNGVFFQKNGTGFAQITGNSATLAITPQAGFLTASIVNTVADLINFGSAATIINIGNAAGAVTFNGNINANGNTTLGNANSDRVLFNAYVTSSILPSNDSAFDLGSPGLRWQNVYTGDLHLRNDRGDYTLIEEEDFLSIRFNKTGKRYKFLLEAVPALDEK